ncbi:iron-molybdenum cofactor biosynthesis protein [bacterium]|nr:iron-molybdenum cofactor biosynthesis protein [bacterium]
MNIAIASDDGTYVSQHFGRTRGFVIFTQDDSGEKQRYVRNDFTQHARGEHQHHEGAHQHHEGAHQQHDHHQHGGHQHSHEGILAALEGCDIVVAGGMGRRLREDLHHAGIEAIVTDQQTVEGVIEEARGGMLVHQADRHCAH